MIPPVFEENPFASSYRVKFDRDSFLELFRRENPEIVFHVGRIYFFACQGFVVYTMKCNKSDFEGKIIEAVRQKYEEKGVSLKDAETPIAEVLAQKILDGEKDLLKEYWQQKDGRPKQPITGGDEDDKPISILTNVIQRDNSTSSDSQPQQEN